MSTTNTQTTLPIALVDNKDTGSLPVGLQLDVKFQVHGMKPEAGQLLINIKGEASPRVVTYVMGSKAKGFSLCSKGSGPFPKNGEFTLTYDAE